MGCYIFSFIFFLFNTFYKSFRNTLNIRIKVLSVGLLMLDILQLIHISLSLSNLMLHNYAKVEKN